MCPLSGDPTVYCIFLKNDYITSDKRHSEYETT